MGLTEGSFSESWKNSFRRLYFHLCVFAANLLSILIGIVISWDLNCQAEEYGTKAWIYTSLPLTAMPMPLIFSYIASRWGRKLSLLLTCLPLLLSDMVLYFSTCNTPLKTYLLARSMAGISLGGLTTILPLYIQELSHSAGKPSLNQSYRIFVSVGIFISFTTERSTIPHIFISSIILLFIVLLMSFMPETPQYLIRRKRELRAKAVLIKLRNSSLIDAEFRILCAKYSARINIGFATLWRMQRSTLASNLVMVLLKECTSANIVVFYARDIFQYANAINIQVLPPWQPPEVGVQVCILGVTHCLAGAGLWHCLRHKSEKHYRSIVGTCFVVVCMLGLIPIAWYFKVINNDVQILADYYTTIAAIDKSGTSNGYKLTRELNFTSNLINLRSQLTPLSQNVQLTCWVPLVTFFIILTCHHVLGVRLESQINDSPEELWMRATCQTLTWILWFFSGMIFKSMDMVPMVVNNVWIWWSMCGFGSFLGMAVTFAYLSNETFEI